MAAGIPAVYACGWVALLVGWCVVWLRWDEASRRAVRVGVLTFATAMIALETAVLAGAFGGLAPHQHLSAALTVISLGGTALVQSAGLWRRHPRARG
jgi:hypothetical protein